MPKKIETSPAAASAELPTVTTLGVQPVSKGFVVVLVQTRGDRVIGRDVLCLPMKRFEAEDVFRVECFKKGVLS